MRVPSSENSTPEVAPVALQKKTNSVLAEFERSIGGREILIETLELAPLDKKQEHLLNLLLDPKRHRDTLNVIARDAGMKPSAVIDIFRSAIFAKAHAIAMNKMANALPAVVQDIADKSIDAKIECPTCFGQKVVQNVDCPTCFGKGEIMRFSDLDRQKILLDAAGLTKKSQPGVNVNVNQQVGIVNPGGFFSSFVKGTDKDAYDVEPEIIDIGVTETTDGK